MLTDIRRSLFISVFTFVLCAVIYPGIVWGVGQLIFPQAAEGSLLKDEGGRTIGSLLIAQKFQAPGYFHPRPSAAGASGYAADAASGSNLGPNDPALRERIVADTARELALQKGGSDLAALLAQIDETDAQLAKLTDPSQERTALDARKAELKTQLTQRVLNWNQSGGVLVPTELVTTSGSGLDPHISPEAARFQVPRVAEARGLATEKVEALVEAATTRNGWILGHPPVVNVLRLNLDLDAASSHRPMQAR